MGGIFNKDCGDWISVDFTLGANPNAYNKFNDIRICHALQSNKDKYINAQNIKTVREVEPLRLILSHRPVSLRCLAKNDYRLFRLANQKG